MSSDKVIGSRLLTSSDVTLVNKSQTRWNWDEFRQSHWIKITPFLS